MMKLNLGCGSDYRQGWLNVDRRADVRPDLVMNLEDTRWPLPDNCADEVLLKHVLTNIGQDFHAFECFLRELYRVCKPDARIHIHVAHPRHKDFLSDPTSIRPITPELFECLDLERVELWQENQLPGTPLAKYLEVDYQRVDVQYHLTSFWQKEQMEGRIDAAGVMHAIDTYNNVVEQIEITLRVRKPFRPGYGLRKVDAICIERFGGMGDVLMAMAAAKALKILSGRPVILLTAPGWHTLARACPHITHVARDISEVRDLYANIKHVNFAPVAYGLSRLHQIDAYLSSFGVSASADIKNLELTIDDAIDKKVADLLDSWPARTLGRRRILVHMAQGDPNRTWPTRQWEELAARLVEAGHQVIIIGTTNDPEKIALLPAVEGTLSAVDRLSVLETVALMRRSDVLVSADNGPVHLAGASDIAIVGLFSVVKGACRLPFRHGAAMWNAQDVIPSCSYYPCFKEMNNPAIFAPFATRMLANPAEVNSIFANWCPDGGSFSCMKEQITVDMVMAAIERACSNIEPWRPGRDD
jgi:hypothetical protein